MFAGTLQDAYDACGPGNDYDKYLELDPHGSYTGGLTVDSGLKSCIVGNYAKVSLYGYDSILARYSDTRLDISNLVIYGDRKNTEGICYHFSSTGIVNFCTVYGHETGVSIWGAGDVVTIKNSIISGNRWFGITWNEVDDVHISYCDVWDNPNGNYKEYCND